MLVIGFLIASSKLLPWEVDQGYVIWLLTLGILISYARN